MIICNTLTHINFLNFNFKYKFLYIKSTIEPRRTSYITHIYFILNIKNFDKIVLDNMLHLILKDI